MRFLLIVVAGFVVVGAEADVQKCISTAGDALRSNLKAKVPTASSAVISPENNSNLTAYIENSVVDLVQKLSTAVSTSTTTQLKCNDESVDHLRSACRLIEAGTLTGLIYKEAAIWGVPLSKVIPLFVKDPFKGGYIALELNQGIMTAMATSQTAYIETLKQCLF